MKRILIACVLACTLQESAGAADDTAALLAKALDELSKTGAVGDNSTAERYLGAVLEVDPDNLEARWQILNLRLAPLKNVPLYARAEPLSALSPEFGRLAKIAARTKQEAFFHFMAATHAGYYNDFERALAEIDRAVALDRTQARYLTAKGRLLVGSGRWGGSDAQVEQGIAVLNEARTLAQARPGPFVREEFYDFYLADAYSSLRRPRWQETATHYQRFLEKAEPCTMSAFAWNNLSIAYRRLGACDRAREAAGKALEVMKFGAAEQNRRYADFCLEMQDGGAPAGGATTGGPTTGDATGAAS